MWRPIHVPYKSQAMRYITLFCLLYGVLLIATSKKSTIPLILYLSLHLEAYAENLIEQIYVARTGSDEFLMKVIKAIFPCLAADFILIFFSRSYLLLYLEKFIINQKAFAFIMDCNRIYLLQPQRQMFPRTRIRLVR